jgi:large subunit ribosomal protein L15
VPKHGFNQEPFRTDYHVANVRRLQRLVDEGRLDADETVTPERLADVGAVRSADRVKILGDGDVEVALEVSAHDFSDSAREKIEDAGGSVTVVDE